MSEAGWRIGDLAKAAGLTTRALRHYDRVGLLAPSGRTPAGHRLYLTPDVRRLYQILALRRLGLSLPQIASALDGDGVSLEAVIERHLEHVDREIEARTALRKRLALALSTLRRSEQLSVGDLVKELIEVMERMTMLERYLAPEQLAKLREHRGRLGDAAMTNAWQERAALTAELEAARQAGEDPASPRVAELRRRFVDLHKQFIGDDDGVLRSLQTMVETEGVEAASGGIISAELRAYLGAPGSAESESR